MNDIAMPSAFLGHGSPMNAVESNRWTESWQTFGLDSPKPRAILVISAHWYVNATAVTAMPSPRTIHDFYGFPDELFAVQYPAPGDPDLAREIAEALAPHSVELDRDSWGIDHGAWSVLVHVRPEADVPVIQLSINASKPLADHFALGVALEPLRALGIMIIGSGNVVHNLGRIDWSSPDGGYDSTRRFDERAREIMTSDPSSIGQLLDHPDWSAAVPTPEHFLPLAYIAGIAAAAGTTAQTLIEGYAFGSLSMTSYVVSR